MRLTTVTNLIPLVRGKALSRRFGLILMLASAQLGYLAAETDAQALGQPMEAARQVPAVLPKLSLTGAVGENLGRIQYHKIILAITNWDKYPSEMFSIPQGRKLPPNPCAAAATRMVLAVYSERGALLASCIAMPKAADLGKFAFRIQKGKQVPEYVYAVLNDRHTGAVYRSNLVSPFGGATK